MNEFSTVVVRGATAPIQLGNELLGGVICAASVGNLVEQNEQLAAEVERERLPLTAAHIEQAAPLTKKTGWISVADRLPERDGPYWCWFGKEAPSVIQQRVCFFVERHKKFAFCEVTHWMELPDAPANPTGETGD